MSPAEYINMLKVKALVKALSVNKLCKKGKEKVEAAVKASVKT